MFRLTLIGLAFAATPVLAERIVAQAACSPTDTALRFTCEIALSQGGVPVEEAAFTVKLDMPSMPMAHNIPPVSAQATQDAGIYVAPLTLDMLGDWTLTLDLTAPRRDRIVLRQTFDGVMPEHGQAGHSGHGSTD